MNRVRLKWERAQAGLNVLQQGDKACEDYPKMADDLNNKSTLAVSLLSCAIVLSMRWKENSRSMYSICLWVESTPASWDESALISSLVLYSILSSMSHKRTVQDSVIVIVIVIVCHPWTSSLLHSFLSSGRGPNSG